MRIETDITHAIEQHADTVLRVCSLFFQNRPERDDAFQETFIKYARSDKEFADDEHRKAWLIRVAKNTCKDMLKRSEARVILLDRIDETAQPQWAPEPSADDGKTRLARALQTLDDKSRVVLYLKYYEGYSAKEIADLLELPENTVYTNLARGRSKLKEVLNRE